LAMQEKHFIYTTLFETLYIYHVVYMWVVYIKSIYTTLFETLYIYEIYHVVYMWVVYIKSIYTTLFETLYIDLYIYHVV